jgi:pimeloyl-ACP methyl ester carboxylesterase
MLRALLFLAGVALALPILAISALSFRLPVTISWIGYLLGSVFAAAGLILFPWAGRKSIWMTMLGITLIAAVATFRLILVRQNPNPSIRMIALPQGKDTHWINTLIDEQDSLIVGEALFHGIGGDSPDEHNGISSALHTDYSQIRATQGAFSSPFLSTYLNLQRSTHFDAILIESEINHPPEFALVFLHGYMGNVVAQCWEIAQAVNRFGAMAICPSTGWKGDWWQPQGQAILQSTFEYLRGQGIQKFYLGGFSNGGISIGRLASHLKNEKGLHGLILIDGFDNGMGIRELGLPILLLEGLQDERIPPAYARQVAAEIGELGTYVELNGDHFLIMKQPASVQNAITEWLKIHEVKQ